LIHIAGAVTFGNGSVGVAGLVTPANSLVGAGADELGYGGVFALPNGNYVVASPNWSSDEVYLAGAVTFANGFSGIVGEVSASNSLVGTTERDHVGYGVRVLPNGNYLVHSKYWNNGATPDAGAVTFASGTAGITGPVSAANSLVGTTAND